MPGSLGPFLGQLHNDSDSATICTFAPRSVRACVPLNVTLRVRSGLWPILRHQFRLFAVVAETPVSFLGNPGAVGRIGTIRGGKTCPKA